MQGVEYVAGGYGFEVPVDSAPAHRSLGSVKTGIVQLAQHIFPRGVVLKKI